MTVAAGWGNQQIKKNSDLQWGLKLNPMNKTHPQTILSTKQKFVNWNLKVIGIWKWDRRGQHQTGTTYAVFIILHASLTLFTYCW
jgi:hypothetical protein